MLPKTRQKGGNNQAMNAQLLLPTVVSRLCQHTCLSYSQPFLDSPETSYIGATSTRSHPTMFSPLQPRMISKA